MALRIEYEQEALEDIANAASTALERFGADTADKLLARVRKLVTLIAEDEADVGLKFSFPSPKTTHDPQCDRSRPDGVEVIECLERGCNTVACYAVTRST